MELSAPKSAIYPAAREFFQVALVTYLLLTLAETLKTGFVSNFFNMNYLLLVVLVAGVAMVLTEPEEGPVRQAVEKVAQMVPPLRPAISPRVLDLRPARKPLEERRKAAARQMHLRPEAEYAFKYGLVRSIAQLRREEAKRQLESGQRVRL